MKTTDVAKVTAAVMLCIIAVRIPQDRLMEYGGTVCGFGVLFLIYAALLSEKP